MVKALPFFLFVLCAAADPISTLSYSGSPCVTSPPTSGITGQGSETIVAAATAYYNPAEMASPPASSCVLSISDELVTAGSGSGFLSFSTLGGEVGDGGEAEFYLNGVLEESCSTEAGCFNESMGPIQLTLGTPFEISVDANAASVQSGCCLYSSGIQITIQAYDVVNLCPDGCSEQQDQVISEFVAPEPGTWWLVLLGIAATIAGKRYHSFGPHSWTHRRCRRACAGRRDLLSSLRYHPLLKWTGQIRAISPFLCRLGVGEQLVDQIEWLDGLVRVY